MSQIPEEVWQDLGRPLEPGEADPFKGKVITTVRPTLQLTKQPTGDVPLKYREETFDLECGYPVDRK